MGLIGNYSVLNKSHARFTNGTATAGAYAGQTRSNFMGPSILRSRDQTLPAKTSVPNGYNVGEAFISARSSGGLSSYTRIGGEGAVTAALLRVRFSEATISGSGSVTAGLAVLTPAEASIAGVGSVTAALLATSSMASTISAAGSVSANLSAIIPMASTLAGVASLSPNLTGTGRLEAEITPFTELSPTTLAAAVWSAETTEFAESGTFGERTQKTLTLPQFLGLK